MTPRDYLDLLARYPAAMYRAAAVTAVTMERSFPFSGDVPDKERTYVPRTVAGAAAGVTPVRG